MIMPLCYGTYYRVTNFFSINKILSYTGVKFYDLPCPAHKKSMFKQGTSSQRLEQGQFLIPGLSHEFSSCSKGFLQSPLYS